MSTNTTTGLLARTDVRKFDTDAVVKGVKGVSEASHGIATQADSVMWNAALLYGAARANDMIGGKTPTWQTQGDYARACGYKDSTGTLLSRLATAQDKGVRHGSAAWSFLVKFGTSGRVGQALKDAESGKVSASLKDLMAEAHDTGKVASKAKGAPAKVASEKDSEPESKPVTTPEDVLAVLHALRVPVHAMNGEQWAKVERAMVEFVKAEQHRRTAVKPQVTPATVAKAAKATKAA